MCKTLLQQLYDGEIYPAEAVGFNNLEYRELNRKISDGKKDLEVSLSSDDRNRFGYYKSKLILPTGDIPSFPAVATAAQITTAVI